MTDVHTPEQRSRNMSRIRSKDTKPELVLRKGLHGRGLRYRLHQRGLPGTPDLVFTQYRAVVFVNGCFWHGHDCHLFVIPETNREFWLEKIGKNSQRDARAKARLRADGWRVLTVWECALKGKKRLPLDQLLEDVADWVVSGPDEKDIPSNMGLAAHEGAGARRPSAQGSRTHGLQACRRQNPNGPSLVPTASDD